MNTNNCPVSIRVYWCSSVAKYLFRRRTARCVPATWTCTFSLPADLVRQAKIYAAEHDTTVNTLVRKRFLSGKEASGVGYAKW